MYILSLMTRFPYLDTLSHHPAESMRQTFLLHKIAALQMKDNFHGLTLHMQHFIPAWLCTGNRCGILLSPFTFVHI